MAENTDHRLLQRAGPVEKHRLKWSEATVPPDVLRDASKRLAICALAMAAMLFIFYIIYTLVPLLGGSEVREPFGLIDIILIATVALSLGLFRFARSERLEPKKMLDLGLVYEVVLGFLGGVVIKLVPGRLHIPADWGISDICILILVFPVIVPNTPKKTLLAALITATLDPAGTLLALSMGKTLPPGANLYIAYAANYICAGLALLPSFIIGHLHRQVGEAREMGSYRMTKLLGQGGMGEVWRASHRLLARDAAIKLLRPDIVGGPTAVTLLKRFEREAQVTAMMRSPHTIDLYDFGITEDGTFFYVMELLEGLDMESLVQRFGPMSSARTIHFLKQACDSLGEAHLSNLIHRDIKPANIYVCRYGRRVDFVKVLDFGLVKPKPEMEQTDVKLTAEHVAGGTPTYMAPEQALGNRPVDPRTDIYALGCVAYWLLTGQLVFEGATPMEAVLHHVQTAPVPPSKRSELEIPAALEKVVLSCLEKDPDYRPQSADELAEMLASCEDGVELWTHEKAHEWWDMHLPAIETRGAVATRSH
jgi:serine/threonine-protein kinase